jgi:hypothetical protein
MTPFSCRIYAALAGVLLMKESFATLVCIEPMAVKSGVPTCSLDGVTFIRIGYKYFKYLN